MCPVEIGCRKWAKSTTKRTFPNEGRKRGSACSPAECCRPIGVSRTPTAVNSRSLPRCTKGRIGASDYEHRECSGAGRRMRMLSFWAIVYAWLGVLRTAAAQDHCGGTRVNCWFTGCSWENPGCGSGMCSTGYNIRDGWAWESNFCVVVRPHS